MSDSYVAVKTLGWQIRHLCEQDLPDILEIERRSYSFPWSEAVFRDCFRSNYRIWGIADPEGLAGYAVVAYLMDEAHLLNLCIAGQRRRSGMARSLLRHLVGDATSESIAQVLLEVRDSNCAAAGLYFSEGFVEIGRRPGYYPSSVGREDARVLALSIAKAGH